MKNIWIIAKREFQTFFDSLVAYILLIAFLGFIGFFTWLYGADIFLVKQADLRVFFDIAPILFAIFIPALTMRMIAEEKKTGTLEVLLTRAVSDWEIIAGKYLACMLLVGAALLFTIPYYMTVAWFGACRSWSNFMWLRRFAVFELCFYGCRIICKQYYQ